MTKRPKEPAVPSERHETVRHEIISLLERGSFSAKEISPEVSVSEKMVYDHLDHIRHKKGLHLVVKPAECRKCSYTFIKRERLKKPGRCPVCKGEFIKAPLFSIEAE